MQVARLFEQHVRVDPMLLRQFRHRHTWLTRCRGQAVLELARIIRVSLAVVRLANSAHSSPHQKVMGTIFAE